MVKTKDIFNKTSFGYIIWLSVGTILVVLLLSFFVIKPSVNKAKTLSADVKVKKTELKALEDKKIKLDGLKDKEEELKADAETVKNALPEIKDAGRLFIQIDKLAKENGGVVKSINEGSTSETTNQGDVSQVPTGMLDIQKLTYAAPIDFNSYFSFKEFLTKSESALRLVNIDSFSIKVNETGSLAVNLMVTTYVRGK
ncbi:MAG: type 4a pilus biogenesis protein PilO [bacterium]